MHKNCFVYLLILGISIGLLFIGCGDDDDDMVNSGISENVWAKTYSSTYFSKANSIEQTTDGNYIVAGSSSVLKLDSAGNVIWEKTYVEPDKFAGYHKEHENYQSQDQLRANLNKIIPLGF